MSDYCISWGYIVSRMESLYGINPDDEEKVAFGEIEKRMAYIWQEYFEWKKMLYLEDAEPVSRGRWLAIKEKAPWLVCSECGTYLYNEQKSVAKYCYNCGAKMEEE